MSTSQPTTPVPIVGAVAVLVAGGVWSTWFLLQGGGPAVLAGVGGWLLTLLAVAGLLVARGRWSVRVGTVVCGLAVAAMASPAVTRPSGFVWSALGVSAVTAFLLHAPVTRRHVRPDRSPDAPPDGAVALMTVLVGAPLAVAFGHWTPESWATGRIGVAGWLLAVAGPLLAWWFGRVSVAALWTARVGVPALALVAGILAPWSTGWVVVVFGLVVGWLGWRPDATIAARPLAPVQGSGKPVFAELAPQAVRDAGGLDDRGRR